MWEVMGEEKDGELARKRGEQRGAAGREPGKRRKRTGQAFERGGQNAGRCRAFENRKLRPSKAANIAEGPARSHILGEPSCRYLV